MKLSDLIEHRYTVERLDTNGTLTEFKKQIDLLINDTISFKSGLDDSQQNLTSSRDKVLIELENFMNNIEAYKKELNTLIRAQEIPYIQKSYQLYEESKNDDPEYIIDRFLYKTLIHRDEIKLHFKSRIDINSSWEFPGMFIRPETGELIDTIIACDPLYIVDDYRQLFDSVKRKWTTEFQDRLRYKLLDTQSTKKFKGFPSNQFGLIVALNYFNFIPLDIMKNYFLEIYDLLRPGGVFMFTYNNCDLPGNVRNVEKSMYSYTPGILVESLCTGIGFEIVQSIDYQDTNVSWLEIKKPGELKSMRGGQALAKIITQKADRI